jgi:hypothetical protein
MKRFIESLREGEMRVRIASADGADSATILHLIEEVFVRERGYMKSVEVDPWDAIARYYLVTAAGRPVGCVRFVDPGAFSSIPGNIPRKGNRLTFPMEEFFPLDGYVTNSSIFAEPGRFILLPAFRKRGAFVALAATAYLYGLRNAKRGVCMASPMVFESFLKLGWTRLGDPVWIEPYESYGHPLTASPQDVSSAYQSLFLSMEQSGVIVI